MKQLLSSILLIICPAVYVIAQMPQTVNNGFSVEREIGGAERHFYEVNLTKGQMLNFIVEQRGVDVVLRVLTADGKFYDRIDSPNGTEGDEPIKFVSLAGGRYRFEISRLYENSPTGKYFIKPMEIRKATEAETKSQTLEEELLKIVAEDNRLDFSADLFRRTYSDRAWLINPFGYVLSVPELLDFVNKNPPKPVAGSSSEVELSEVQMQDFGDLVLLNLSQSRHSQNPKENLNRTITQRVGYVFKRVKSEWRIFNVQRTLIGRIRQPVKLDVPPLDALTGVYEGGKPSETLTVSRENNVLYGKYPTGEKFELVPESANVFYADSFISVAFISSNGTTAQAVVHYPLPEDRMTILPKTK